MENADSESQVNPVAEPGLVNRLSNPDKDLALELCGIVAGTLRDWDHQEKVLGSIPTELTADEINSLGLQVSSFIETLSPSWDAISRGSRYERSILLWLGFKSIDRKDFVTAYNAKDHLRKRGLKGRLKASIVQLALDKATARNERSNF